MTFCTIDSFDDFNHDTKRPISWRINRINQSINQSSIETDDRYTLDQKSKGGWNRYGFHQIVTKIYYYNNYTLPIIFNLLNFSSRFTLLLLKNGLGLERLHPCRVSRVDAGPTIAEYGARRAVCPGRTKWPDQCGQDLLIVHQRKTLRNPLTQTRRWNPPKLEISHFGLPRPSICHVLRKGQHVWCLRLLGRYAR